MTDGRRRRCAIWEQACRAADGVHSAYRYGRQPMLGNALDCVQRIPTSLLTVRTEALLALAAVRAEECSPSTPRNGRQDGMIATWRLHSSRCFVCSGRAKHGWHFGKDHGSGLH